MTLAPNCADCKMKPACDAGQWDPEKGVKPCEPMKDAYTLWQSRTFITAKVPEGWKEVD